MELVFVDYEITPKTKTTPPRLRELCVLSPTDTLMQLSGIDQYSITRQKELVEILQQMYNDYGVVSWANAFDHYVLQETSNTLLHKPMDFPCTIDFQILYGNLRNINSRIALRKACLAETIRIPSNMRFHTAQADALAIRTLFHQTQELDPLHTQYTSKVEAIVQATTTAAQKEHTL